jgi:4-amino-4-deoxy-L-arabinose transferase-like glycosyltransferase
MQVNNRPDRARLDIGDGILALVTGVLALIIYGRTVTPGLLPGDSGEFQTLTYLLGNTHPTGYPVYLALARLFAFLPLGELAYRVNLFSAVMGAITVAGVYLCGRVLTGFRAIALAVAIAFTVSATFWSQALIAEIYTAGAAFFAFTLFALLWWDATDSKRALFAAGLLGGLSLGVHMSVGLLAPAVLLFMLLHGKRGWQMWQTAISGATAGLIITIVLFVLIDLNNPPASYFNSVIEPSRSAWNLAADEIDGPIDHLLFGWQGRQFQYLMFADVGEVMPRQAGYYWANLSSEFALPLIMLAVVGVIGSLVRRPRATALLLGALIIQLVYFFNYEIWDLYVFYIPSYLLVALLAIFGLGVLVEFASWALGKVSRSQNIQRVPLDIVLAILVVVLAAWPVFQPYQQAFAAGEVPFDFDEYPVYDESVHLRAAALVANLPEAAIVFTDWDMMWPYYHTAYLENGRSDLIFIETFPDDSGDGIADSMAVYVADHINDHPIFFEERISQLEQTGDLSLSPTRIGGLRLFQVRQN